MKWNSRLSEHMWLDNDTITWANWASGEPDCTDSIAIWSCNHGKELCVMVTDQWEFHTAACDVERCGALCQMGKYYLYIFIRDD